MTAYFDDLRRELGAIQAADPQDWLRQVADIEWRVAREVQRVTGDREFPDDLRERMLSAIATRAVFDVGPALPASRHAIDYACATKASDLLETLHSLFHRLAGRRVRTRFGLLSDSPRAILAARKSYDDELAEEIGL